MSNIDPPASWADIDGINTNERLLGGPSGPLNRAVTGLTARSKYLRDLVSGANAAASIPFTSSAAGAVQQSVGYVLDGAFVTPETFGAAGEGGDDAAFFLAALSSGRPVRLAQGKTYRIATAVAFSPALDVYLDGTGAVILQNGNTKVFDLVNTATGLVGATCADATFDFSVGASALTQCTAITAPGHNFAVGDVGRVFSDDLVEGSDAAGQFCAEFFVVGAVAGNVVYTTGRLVETYSTGVKVCKPASTRVQMHNVAVRRGSGSTAPATAIAISGFIAPTLTGMDGRGLLHEYLAVRGCLQAVIENPVAINLRNDTAAGSYGYGVNDCSSQGTRVVNLRARYCRHAYTTTAGSAVAGDNLWYLRGRTIDSYVTDGEAIGCAGAWDTHSPALGVVFANCATEDDYRGDTSGGFGYQLRAKNCSILGCKARNSRIGIAVIGGAAASQSARVVGFQYTGPADHIPIVCTGQSASPVSLLVEGSHISTQAQYAIDLTHTRARLVDVAVTARSSDSGAQVLSLRAGARVQSVGGALGVDTALAAWAVHKDASSSLFSRGLVVRGFSGVPVIANCGTFDVVSQHLDWDTDATLAGAPFSGLGANAQASFAYRTLTNDRPLAFRTLTVGVAGNTSLNLVNSGEATIVFRVEATVAGVVVNSITKGAYRGQTLLVLNRDTSLSDLTITSSGAGNISIGTSVNVAVGKGFTLVWDGAFWRAGAGS